MYIIFYRPLCIYGGQFISSESNKEKKRSYKGGYGRSPMWASAVEKLVAYGCASDDDSSLDSQYTCDCLPSLCSRRFLSDAIIKVWNFLQVYKPGIYPWTLDTIIVAIIQPLASLQHNSLIVHPDRWTNIFYLKRSRDNKRIRFQRKNLWIIRTHICG